MFLGDQQDAFVALDNDEIVVEQNEIEVIEVTHETETTLV